MKCKVEKNDSSNWVKPGRTNEKLAGKKRTSERELEVWFWVQWSHPIIPAVWGCFLGVLFKKIRTPRYKNILRNLVGFVSVFRKQVAKASGTRLTTLCEPKQEYSRCR